MAVGYTPANTLAKGVKLMWKARVLKAIFIITLCIILMLYVLTIEAC